MFAKELLASAALCGASLISNALGFQGASSTPTNGFNPGDEVIAAVPRAALMRGYSTLATVVQGQTLRVLKVEGPWVGTAVTVDGAKAGGWIWRGQLMTPQQYQAMRQAARRRYSYQPTPVYEPGYEGYYWRAPTYSRRSMGPSNWRADRKILGY